MLFTEDFYYKHVHPFVEPYISRKGSSFEDYKMYADCHHQITGERGQSFDEEQLFLEMFSWISKGIIPLIEVIDTIEKFIAQISDPEMSYFFINQVNHEGVYISLVAKLALQRWLSLVDHDSPDVQKKLTYLVVKGIDKDINITRAIITTQ